MTNETLSFAHQPSPTISLFDLPEITINISSCLHHRDIARCIQVCKSWYHTFLPSVWSPPHFLDINLLIEDEPWDVAYQPTLASFLRHAAIVRDSRFLHLGHLGEHSVEYLSAPGLT
ncbi:MAG: hypothetical protein JOS17DRAFT_788799 [Linnemannia elongata]|nr:MAG: hypothetical protein JOS17DRAFT_788799 [Linnemannia elongata]